MNRRLNLAIIGLDNWYHAFPFAELLMRRKDVALKAVSDEDELKREWIRNRYHIPVYAEHERILADPAIDGVIITARTSQHLELIEAAVAEGKHVLCDKPLEVNVERAERVVKIVNSASTVFCMSFPRRARPLFLEAKRLIATRVLGELCCIIEIGRYRLPCKAPGVIDPGWYAEKTHSGGGGFIDHAVHQIDMLRWWLEDEVASVCCMTGNQAVKNIEVEDYGVAILRFDKGVLATIESSWVSHEATKDVIEVQGTEGALRIDVESRTLEVYSSKLSCKMFYTFKPVIFETPDFRLALDGFDGILNSFIDCIVHGGRPLATVEDGWAATAVTAAAYESAKFKKEISVPRLR